MTTENMPENIPAFARVRRRALTLLPLFIAGFALLVFSGQSFNGADIAGAVLVAVFATGVARAAEPR